MARADWQIANKHDLNDTFKSRERTKFNGIEGLCLVCERLAYPVRLYTLEKSYGRS